MQHSAPLGPVTQSGLLQRAGSLAELSHMLATEVAAVASNPKRKAKRIKEYSEYCKSQGIEYIFMPIPNKETIYFEDVPFNLQPNYLIKLEKELSRIGIETVNTLKLFNKHKSASSNILYHLDDSHWNKYGIELTSDELVLKLKDKGDN